LKKLMWGAIMVLLISISGLYYFQSYPEWLREDIYQQNGYTLQVLNKKEPITFEFKKGWMDIQEETDIGINEVIQTKGASIVTLESIYRDNGQYHISLNIKQDFNSTTEGRFLSFHEIKKNSFAVRDGRAMWSFYTMDREQIDGTFLIGGQGSGPGEDIKVKLNVHQLSELEKPFLIKADVFLYQYRKL